MGWGVWVVFDLALEPIKLPRSWTCGRGEVADETEEESYDLLDGLGERGKGLCDDAAIVIKELQDPSYSGLVGRSSPWLGLSPVRQISGESYRSRDMYRAMM